MYLKNKFCCDIVESAENYRNSKFINFEETRKLCVTKIFIL